jgi:endonuclease/exonuclease/phosphatase family metal-dependent hydrolase
MRTFRVATLNIWNRMGPWEARLEVIRERLAELDPDVLGLQEVVRFDDHTFDQAVLIAQGLGYQTAFGAASRANNVPFGNAVLSKWPIGRQAVLPLPSEGTEERRALLFVEIQAPFGIVPFFVTHLNWKFHHGSVRRAQIRVVADRIADFAPITGFPPVLCGDLNAEPDADEIRFLRGLTPLGGRSVYFADAFGIAGEGPAPTFARENPYAAALREPDRRIDYIFVRGPDDRGRGEVLSARRCFDKPRADIYASDHFGVVATIAAGVDSR